MCTHFFAPSVYIFFLAFPMISYPSYMCRLFAKFRAGQGDWFLSVSSVSVEQGKSSDYWCFSSSEFASHRVEHPSLKPLLHAQCYDLSSDSPTPTPGPEVGHGALLKPVTEQCPSTKHHDCLLLALLLFPSLPSHVLVLVARSVFVALQ